MTARTTITIPPGACVDDYLWEHRRDTRFELGCGEYTTRGGLHAADCVSLGAGCELVGAGSRHTMLRLMPERSSDATAVYHEILTAGSRSGVSEWVRVSGITIDAWAARPCVGLHIWSADAVVQDVRVTGLWGDPRPGSVWEGFGILVNRSGVAEVHDGGARVEDCTVEFAQSSPAGLGTRNYATGIYVGMESRPDRPLSRSAVTRCRVLGCFDGFMPDVGFGINSATTISDCEALGVKRGVFSDTGEGRNARITSSRLAVGYSALDLKSARTDWPRVNVVMDSCDVDFFRLADTDHVAALVLDDQSPSKDQAIFESVWLERCRISHRAYGATGYMGSLNGSRSDACGARACQWIGPWKSAVVTRWVPAKSWSVTP